MKQRLLEKGEEKAQEEEGDYREMHPSHALKQPHKHPHHYQSHKGQPNGDVEGGI